MNTQQSIEKLGWQVETNGNRVSGKSEHRASQGGFKTLWRDTPEAVLKDVQAIVEARKQPTAAPF